MNPATLRRSPPHSRPFMPQLYFARMIPDPPRVSYWEASPHLQRLCRRKLGDAAWRMAEPRLASMGERAALEVAPLAQIADREGPRLVNGRVEYHQAYREMQKIA